MRRGRTGRTESSATLPVVQSSKFELLLLFFRIDNSDVALPRALALVSRLEEEPHVNPSTGTAEFSLRDPDGYYVTISALNAP
jgi:hypothetical protein